MPKKSQQKRGGLKWIALVPILVTLVSAGGCTPTLDDLGKYPAPPPTQKLATLMAQGIATTIPEYPDPRYPPPIPGPLRGPNPTLTPTEIQTEDPIPQAVQASKYYLAGRLDVTPEDVSTTSWEPVVWNTTDLGCLPTTADPGQISGNAQMNGYRIRYQVAGQPYELRSDENGKNICVVEAMAPGEQLKVDASTTPQQTVDLARMHLSRRMGISLEQITVEGLQSVEWTDEELACQSTTGEQTTQVAPNRISGQRILLSVQNTLYEYRSRADQLVYCGNPSN
jgi:hypothetical protein